MPKCFYVKIMENVNTTSTAAQRQKQQQQQEQQQHSFQHLQSENLQQQQQPQNHENQQQFCLRWHNHQTSLLSTLPVLLDQSHLTDVTISAEGRTLRAHRVVLSACSSFFLELFRALDASNHPVIILPGASFAAIVALLTFMYSGEVNVYEEQIPVLLNLAETLGVKGLADVQNNKSASKCRSMDASCEQPRKTEDVIDTQSHSVPSRVRSPTPTPTPPLPPAPPAPVSAPPLASFSAPLQPQLPSQPQPQQSAPDLPAALHPFTNPLLVGKFPTQLESLFLKSLQFYPNLLQQPLNFSQTALNKTTELLAKYQQQCNIYQGALSTLGGGTKETLAPLNEHFAAVTPARPHEDVSGFKRFCANEKTHGCGMFLQQHAHHQHQKEAKRIDKIADSLRFNSNGSGTMGSPSPQLQHSLQAALPISSYAAVTTSTNCNYGQMISPQFSSTKSTTNFTSSAASLLRNQSPHHQQQQQQPHQQHQQQQLHNTAPKSPTSNAAAVFEANIEAQNAAARNLHQQIEQQFAGCNRPCGIANVVNTDLDDVTMAAPSSKCFDNSNGNQQKSPALSAAADKFHGTSKAASSLAISHSPGANAAQGKTPSNSKLYATCFICHKQLSNQYNLRVHLETHQNVRYACNVCSHVSRSKDALRKHVSYRHPGAPSPCETEARRKRASKVVLSGGGSSSSVATASNMPATSSPTPAIIGGALDSGNSSASSNGSEAQIAAAAAHLNSAAAYMFLPNQFHLAAAAAAVVQQQQQQQQHEQQQQQQQQHQHQHQQEKQQLHQQQQVHQTPPQSFSAAVSPMALEIDVTSAAAAVTPIKLEQHSPSSSETTSSPKSSQHQQQQQQQQVKGSDAASNNNTDLLIGLQRSSPT